MWLNLSWKRPQVLLSVIYLFVCVVVLLKTGGLGDSRYITDFDHYHSFWHRYLLFDTSDMSKDLFNSSDFADPSHRSGWMPNPFYSILALFPLTVWGSLAAINIIGMISGLFQVCMFYKIAKKLFSLRPSIAIVSVFACILNKWFIKESIGFTSMSMVTLFAVLALTRDRYWSRLLFHVLAFFVRPNYILFYLPFSLIQIVSSSRGGRYKEAFRWLFPLAIALPWMLLINSSYPGNSLGYLFVSNWMGFDFASNYFPDHLVVMGITSSNVLEWSPSFTTLLSALSDLQALNFFISVWSLKFLAVIGIMSEEMFKTTFGGYVSEIWGTLYSWFITFPSFWVGVFASLRLFGSYDRRSSSLLLASVLYIVSNSMLIGTPRYQLLVMPFLVPGLFGLLEARASAG